MNKRVKESAVVFSTRGQIVIPSGIRRDFGIEEGTRAIVCEIPEGILICPITKESIRSSRGILKRPAGSRPLSEDMASYKKQEKKLEEAKLVRICSR